MKLTDWLHEDDIAIRQVAVYYGIPAFGHKVCYRNSMESDHPLEHVTRKSLGEEDIAIKRCISCGELLVSEVR